MKREFVDDMKKECVDEMKRQNYSPVANFINVVK